MSKREKEIEKIQRGREKEREPERNRERQERYFLKRD